MLSGGLSIPPVWPPIAGGLWGRYFHRAAVLVGSALEAAGLPAAVAFLLFGELWVESDPAAARRVEALVRAEMEAAAAADGLVIPIR
jgi:hypothetical protein